MSIIDRMLHVKLSKFLRRLMSQKIILLGLATGLTSCMRIVSCTAAPLTIVSQGKSTFTIVVPQVAAVSVNEAAAEMQRDIAESTGVKLAIVKDNESIKGPFISLGSTRQAQSANISAKDIADEGFRIVTKNGNLYIIGLDTTTVSLDQRKGGPMPAALDDQNVQEHPEIPGPAYTKTNGLSNGTANGVYTFLENQLGARWLMPGDLGRVVPTKTSFEIPEINRTETPGFISRRMTGMQNGPSVGDWRVHQKLGYSFQISQGHNWVQTIPPSMYDQHPDWFAMNSAGQTKKPTEGNKYYKVETTNPAVVRYFAETAIKALKSNPRMNTFSLSPSDGLGWSQSPASKALYDPPAGGNKWPSVTPLVLKFYHDVAGIVEKEYPQGRLSGYIYSNFSYPPQTGKIKLPENFTPIITGKGFSYGFYDPERRKTASYLLDAWEKVAPSKWFYYCLPTWLRSSSGLIMPSSPNNLNFLFQDLLLKNHVSGVTMYGNYSWSQSAMVNYVGAKMLWNPKQDAKAVQHDWLIHAYGIKAGTVMEEFYNKLDGGWFRPNTYNTEEALFKDCYGPHYPEMEKIFLEAESQTMTPVQKERLGLIRDNLIILQWRLRNAGYLPKDYNSPLTRTNEEVVNQVLSAENNKVPISNENNTAAFWKFVGVISNSSKIKPETIQLGDVPAVHGKAPASINPNAILIYPIKDMQVNIKAGNVLPGSSFLSYSISEGTKRSLDSNILYTGKDITFKAKANTPYYLSVTAGGLRQPIKTEWAVTIANAVNVQGISQDNVLTLQDTPSASLYVYAPHELPLDVHQNASGVVIRTESQADAAARAVSKMQQDAQAALDAALKQYPAASVMQSFNDKWQFTTDPQKSGVQKGFFKADFNDNSWKTVSAIGYWQNHGFKDYHGTAWYRKTFTAPEAATDPLALEGKKLLLYFGAVDGDAVVYLNGQKIGQHIMADYNNGWETPFTIEVTSLLQVGDNKIAVEVTKDNFSGGIYKGVHLLIANAAKE